VLDGVLNLKGAQIARQSVPPQTRRMPVLHLPTLRESAYSTPAETPNSKSLRHLQKLRATPGITEKSYRHFWHGNQGEADIAHGDRIAARAIIM
jgi:hypothetical protein